MRRIAMLHSYTKILVHLVWATKNRERVLTKEVRPLVQRHISEYARENQIALEALNVQMEHVHALINLSSNQKVEDVVKLLKGESSHWINDENMIAQKFSWQRGYGAFSVSPSHYERLKLYINNQDEHHRRKTFAEEYQTILRKYGFSEAETDESVGVST
jgi:putative transposase